MFLFNTSCSIYSPAPYCSLFAIKMIYCNVATCCAIKQRFILLIKSFITLTVILAPSVPVFLVDFSLVISFAVLLLVNFGISLTQQITLKSNVGKISLFFCSYIVFFCSFYVMVN